MSNLTVSSTAADVREFFQHPRYGQSRVATLNKRDGSAAKTVVARENLRGRLHKEAVAMFNEHPSNVKAGRAYFTGATKAAVESQRETALAHRVAAFDANVSVGQRGPLSNAAKTALGLPVAKKAAPKSRKGK